MLSPLTVVWSMAGSVSFTLSLLYAFVWLRRPNQLSYLLFALVAFGGGCSSLTEILLMQATTPAAFVLALKLQHIPIFLLLIPLVWFVRAHFETGRRWLAIVVTVAWSLCLVLNFALPYSLVYAAEPVLRQSYLPWGEAFTVVSAPTEPLKLLADLATLGIIVFIVDASWMLWRGGDHRRALVVGGSAFLFLATGLTGAILTDAGLVELPYMISFLFQIIVLAMGTELTREVVRAGRLAEEVEQRDRRWRTFLEEANLLVVELDEQGRIGYVNPFLGKLTGFDPERLRGQHFLDVTPEELSARYREAFDQSRVDASSAPREMPLPDAHGTQRLVAWSSVPLRDDHNTVTGTISIGTDLTDLRRAELDRDTALARARAALAEVQALKGRLEEEVLYLKDEIKSAYGFDDIVGNSPALRYTLNRLEQVAPLNTTVLIEGETGVGKELVARAIHARSPRAHRAMVKVNCAALPPHLIEAELFGHERGAFTGADRLRHGRFELADSGTLFLDEIGELGLDLQAKLLRVLQDGQFERIGGERTIRVNVRLIAATNRELTQEVKQGRFREDLYYRLHVFPLTVPPLRKRKEDLPALVESFVRRLAAREQRKTIDRIPQAVVDELVAYDWPGNVRELENIIERAVIGTSDGTLRLAERLRHPPAAPPAAGEGDSQLEDVARTYILQVLEMSRWRIEGEQGAAERLGLHPNTLRFRMGKLGIRRPGSDRTVHT